MSPLILYNKPKKKASPVKIPAVTPQIIPLGAETLALVVSSEVCEPASYPDIPYNVVRRPMAQTYAVLSYPLEL